MRPITFDERDQAILSERIGINNVQDFLTDPEGTGMTPEERARGSHGP